MFRFRQIAAPAIVGIGLLAGCTNNDRPNEVPARADTVATGTAGVSTTADKAGTLYIYDETAHKMVYTGKVEKGDRVMVDAKHNKVLFNDKTAVERDLIDDHHYKIYFDRDPHAGDAAYYHDTNPMIIEQRSDGTVIRQGDKTTVVPPAEAPRQQQIIVQPQSSGTSGTTVVQPAAPSGGTTVVQPPPSGSSGTTVVQPGSSGTTVVQPSR